MSMRVDSTHPAGQDMGVLVIGEDIIAVRIMLADIKGRPILEGIGIGI